MDTKLWPLPTFSDSVPEGESHPGAFGAQRRFDRHTGVDLYAHEGTRVVAIEDGTVVAIDPAFTGGPDCPVNAEGEPIWLTTSAVLIEGDSGVILYGEIEPSRLLSVGGDVVAGMMIGRVKRVLRPKPEGKAYANPANSPSMLHLELYRPGTRRAVAVWLLDRDQPAELLDPTSLLQRCDR